MNDTEYQDRVDEMFLRIEDRIDALVLDVDVDSSAGILTLGFEDGSSIILSRQIATHEIWVAARSGGFHLRFVDGDWFCDASGESFGALVNRVFSEQSGSSFPIIEQ